jgi:ribonuclease J
MSTIKVFALGGLGENGKNMSVVEVDDHIFILDAGLKYPSIDLYGIDAVVPDINYLIEKFEKVEK